MAVVLEFWPEYNSGPLWTNGASVDLAGIGLPGELRDRVVAWNALYDDSKLPFERNDEAWIREGQALLCEIREALGAAYEVVDTEPWWHETPQA